MRRAAIDNARLYQERGSGRAAHCRRSLLPPSCRRSRAWSSPPATAPPARARGRRRLLRRLPHRATAGSSRSATSAEGSRGRRDHRARPLHAAAVALHEDHSAATLVTPERRDAAPARRASSSARSPTRGSHRTARRFRLRRVGGHPPPLVLRAGGERRNARPSRARCSASSRRPSCTTRRIELGARRQRSPLHRRRHRGAGAVVGAGREGLDVAARGLRRPGPGRDRRDDRAAVVGVQAGVPRDDIALVALRVV